MRKSAKLALAALACAGLGGLVLWWLADDRRGIAWACPVIRNRFPDVSHMAPSDLDAWLRDTQRPAPQVVDARTLEEFAVSHLPGARRVDPGSSATAALSTLDPNRPVLIYCSAGYRASTLARRLRNAGLRDVWNLEGGIFAWANAGLPLEQDGRPARKVHPYSRIFSRLLKPQTAEPRRGA